MGGYKSPLIPRNSFIGFRPPESKPTHAQCSLRVLLKRL